MAAASAQEEVENKQVILKGYIDAIPQETDMELKLSKIHLTLPPSESAILVKNLYLSCDPYMRGRMRDFHGSYIPPFVPSQVLYLPNYQTSIFHFFFTLNLIKACIYTF